MEGLNTSAHTPKDMSDSKETKAESTPPTAPAAPAAKVTPISADTMALKLIRKSSRVLGTYTAVLAAFMWLFGGILTLFEYNNASLNPLVPVVVDLGLFFFGFFVGAEIIGRMAGSVSAANHPTAKKTA